MVLIITNELDASSYRVMDWLAFFDCPYLQIDKNTPLTILNLSISAGCVDACFEVSGVRLEWNDIDAIWYRRSELNIKMFTFNSSANKAFGDSVNSQLNDEKREIVSFLWELFGKKSINNELDNNLNKLTVLNACRGFGINIPETLITSSKNELIAFMKSNEVITKNVSSGLWIGDDVHYLNGYTQVVSQNDIDSIRDIFSPSLFQRLINKAFELRTFYLNGKTYSSAIFSQSDEKTRIDFRNYNRDKPNRTPPYSLPKSFENKLQLLMKHLGLNCGSLDIVVDTQGTYFLLEINPIGQFTQVSTPCNYQLEKKIAESLIQKI